MRSQPIGIFDSGIGGLATTLAIMQHLPQERVIYFGDTANLPYGEKSPADIQKFSLKICDFLLKQQCKLILIACNSASAAAYDTLVQSFGQHTPILNVIDPVVEYIHKNHLHQKIGLIGTPQTIRSNAYQKKISLLAKQDIPIFSLATPLFVPAIETNLHNKDIINDLIENYLQHDNLTAIDTLILGCTHYPLIKQEIAEYYQKKAKKIHLIDSSELVPKYLEWYLHHHQLNALQPKTSENKFYLSKHAADYVTITKNLFNQDISLECIPLWE